MHSAKDFSQIGRRLILLFGIVTALAIAGCRHVAVSGEPAIDKDGLAGVTPPRSLAVLPTTDISGHADLAPAMREALHAALSKLPLENRQLTVTDQRLAMIANRMGIQPENLPQAALAHPSIADIVVFSRIEKISRVYLILYAHNRFRLDFQMVDTRSRHVFYRNEFVVTNRCFAPTINLFGLAGSAFWSLGQLTTESVTGTFNEGARKIVAELPPMPVFSELGNRLAIVKTNVKMPRTSLGVGDKIQVEVIGTPRTMASFSVGKVTRRLKLREVAPGRYTGEFVVRKGMNTPYAVVEATLRLPNGGETITDAMMEQPFSIDTTPPPHGRVTSWWPARRGKGIFGEIELEKDETANNPEKPSRYIVYRRAPGEKEFAEIAETDATTFSDPKADPANLNEYRIVTRDIAGNDSTPGPVVCVQK
ncbi:hypothetical protein LLG95_08675 [bacterium]|nr:hypothetical protein [bacterium]